MHIVVTARDFSTVEPGHAALLRAAGHTVADHSALGLGAGADPAQVAALAADADAVIAGLEPYPEAVLAACPKLKMISRRGIGYD